MYIEEFHSVSTHPSINQRLSWFSVVLYGTLPPQLLAPSDSQNSNLCSSTQREYCALLGNALHTLLSRMYLQAESYSDGRTQLIGFPSLWNHRLHLHIILYLKAVTPHILSSFSHCLRQEGKSGSEI